MQAVVDEVIHAIYDATMDPGAWDDALAGLIRVTGSGSGNLISSDRDYVRSNVALYRGIDPDWIQRYNDYYYQFDPSMSVFSSYRGRVVVDQVTGPDPRSLADPARCFYNELMRPQAFRHTAGAALYSTDTHRAAFILQRSEQQGPYSGEDIRRLDRLTPHLRRALQLMRQYHQLSFHRGLAAAYENSHLGVILLDAAGQVQYLNRRAEEIVRTFPALDVQGNDMVVADAAVASRLRQRISAAWIPASEEWAKTVDRAPLTLSHDGRALELQVSPVRGPMDSDALGIPSRHVLVQVSDPRPVSPLPAPMLASHFNLTRAEAMVLACVCMGQDTQTVARARSRSVHTIRSQLKTIMKKLGVKSRSELIRLVLTSPVANGSK